MNPAKGLRRFERWLVLAILLVASVARARDLFAPFDRGFEGAQGAFFAIGAVNYERLGFAQSGGYPVLNLELGQPGDPARDLRAHPQSWYLYANHPPLVPLVAWASVAAFAPHGWSAAWKDARPPPHIEAPLRAPFFAASVLSLAALWWAVREAAGARRALCALAVASALPISSVYATLVNYENPALFALLVAVGFFARWIRRGGARALACSAAAFAAGSCVTYAGLFFVPPLVLCAGRKLGARAALRFAAIALGAGLLPIALHAVWSAHVQRSLGLEPAPFLARARELWEPLASGAHPLGEWAALQVERLGTWFTWPIVIAACAGLAAALARALRSHRSKATVASERELEATTTRESELESTPDRARELDLEPALLLGGALYLLAFYRHTLDPQYTFLILLVPAIAGLAALALDLAASALARRRGASVALALLVTALAVNSAVRGEDLRFDLHARPGETRAGRNSPPVALPDATGAELGTLVPPGGFGIHPACVGLNLAVSFYAWRSSWPAENPSDTLPNAVAQRFGLGGAPHVLLLPKDPWPAIAAATAAFEEQWVQRAPPDRESAHWRAWDLH